MGNMIDCGSIVLGSNPNSPDHKCSKCGGKAKFICLLSIFNNHVIYCSLLLYLRRYKEYNYVYGDDLYCKECFIKELMKYRLSGIKIENNTKEPLEEIIE